MESKFTLEERKAIYKKAYKYHLADLRDISADKYSCVQGMCADISEAVGFIYAEYGNFIMDIDLPEFYALKPPDAKPHLYWWDERDLKIRKEMYKTHLLNL